MAFLSPLIFYNCENKITSEKLLLDLFLKHILHGDLNSNNEVTCIFSNVIYKEIDPVAIAHTLLCFSPVKVNSEHELFNIDSITALPKSTEQIIYEGNEIQKRILSSFHGSNNFQPGAVHKIERNIKSIAVTSLLLSSRVTAMPDSAEIKDKYTKPDGNHPLYKEQQRYPESASRGSSRAAAGKRLC
ncbi:T3SS secreted effector EspN-like protein [Salmonella enterica subsp. arizonae]|nr:T3SS secreted effector EspN-like protein [Salmonella enterica subsp. arizonae]